MSAAPMEDGLHVVDDGDGRAAEAAEDGREREHLPVDGDLETLRDAFVDGFNTRDLDALLGLVSADVECPDVPGADGSEAFSEEVQAIWERSPEAFLTRGLLDDVPVAVAWRPDEEGRWTRVALVCFDLEGSLLSLVALPDDVDALDRTDVIEPSEAQLEEWADWAEWDRGEETVAPPAGRHRP
jgi:hypothetical protein